MNELVRPAGHKKVIDYCGAENDAAVWAAFYVERRVGRARIDFQRAKRARALDGPAVASLFTAIEAGLEKGGERT